MSDNACDGLLRPYTSPAEVVRVIETLTAAQEALARLSVFDIVNGIDAAIHHLQQESGVADEGAPFSQWTRPALLHLLEESLGDPALLDGFRPMGRGGGRTRAFGPRSIAHILPGHVPDVVIVSLISALLVKSASLARVSATAPTGMERERLPARFVRALAATQPVLAACCALVTWEHEHTAITKAAFEQVEMVIAYGRDETIAALRPLIPQKTPVLFHGHKVSFGVMSRESLSPETASLAASDVVTHDQRGCLSPHLYYVESGGEVTPLTAAAWIAASLDVACRTRPIQISPVEASQIWQWRGALPLKGGHVFQGATGLDWTVLYDPDPTFRISPQGRTVWVKPVDDLRHIPTYLAPMRPYLQAAGVAIPAGRSAEMAAALAEAGVFRICPIGAMQKPPLTWHHDGRFRLLDLLRFVDWEVA